MKSTCKKIFVILAVLILGVLIKSGKVEAATSSISASTTSPTQGQTVTVTGSVTAGAWNLQLSGAGKTETIYGYTNENANASASKSISFVAGEPGTTYTISLIGDMTDISSNNSEAVNKSIVITVAANTNNSTTSGGNTNNNEGSSGGETTGSNNPETPSTPTTNNQTPTNPTTTPTPQKSSNANLSNLGIRPNDFSGFRQGTTTYNVTVPNDVESVEVYATKADSKATVAGTGTKTLQEGANTLTVTVTAEDGTKKTYTINVTREAVTENEDENTTDENTVPEETIQENQEAIGDGLSELTINNVKLTPSFETGVYEYTAKYIVEFI